MCQIILVACGLLLSGCVAIGATLTTVPTQTLLPRPGLESTATGPPPATVSAVETAGPTPTPFSHIIVEGDSLLGIALQYGVELNDLLLANPGANPRFLTVGSTLVVPFGGAQGPIPTATPRPVELSSVNCYAVLTGELWCFLMAGLAEGPPVEGVVGLVTLVGTGGRPLRTEPAFSPLNLLLPESDLPLVAYFAPPVPEYAAVVASLISAVSAGNPEGRYMAVEVIEPETTISEDKLTGTVLGVLSVNSPADRELDWLRLVALGFDSRGQIVGFTALDPAEAGLPNQGFPFEIEVASLGPPIARVALLVEARAGGS